MAAKAEKVSVVNNTRSEITLIAPAKKKGDSFVREEIKFVRTERDGSTDEHESHEVLLFGKPKGNFQGFPVTLDKSDWDQFEKMPAVKGMLEQNKLSVR